MSLQIGEKSKLLSFTAPSLMEHESMWKNTITFSPTNTEKDLKEVFLWLSILLKTETPLEKQ